MYVDATTVRRIARLSRIELPEADVPAMQGEINAILGFVEQLGEVNVEGVEPMTAVVETRLPMRDDVVTDGGYQEAVLKNAPNAQYGCFSVPKVIE